MMSLLGETCLNAKAKPIFQGLGLGLSLQISTRTLALLSTDLGFSVCGFNRHATQD